MASKRRLSTFIRAGALGAPILLATLAAQAWAQGASPAATPSTEQEVRLSKLELRQEMDEKALDQSSAGLNRFLTLVVGVQALFGLLALYAQFKSQSREQEFAREQSAKYHELLNSFDERNAGFRTAAQESVEKVTALISSMDALFKLTNDAESMEKRLAAREKEALDAIARDTSAP